MPNLDVDDVLFLLTPITIAVAIISGLLIGRFYHKPLATPVPALYTAYVVTMAFLIASGLAQSYESGIWEHWLGVAVLYTIFTVSGLLGRSMKI